MRKFPLVIVIFLLVAAAVVASEPTTIVVGRWDWAAAKFTRDADSALDKGNLADARRNIAEALARAPNFWPALYSRARLYALEGKWESAMRDCNEVLRQYSAYVPAALLRAEINAHIGNYSAARKEFDHLIEIQPRREFYAMAFSARALFRATCPQTSFRNPQGAVDDAKKACTITQWKEAYPLDTLALASAAAGDFDSAVRYDEQAMKAYDAGPMNKSLEQHLAMFKQHRTISGH